MPKTLAQKLRIVQTGTSLGLLHAPKQVGELFTELPPETAVDTALERQYDIVLFFASFAAEVTDHIDAVKAAVKPDGILWLAYPKQSSKAPTDLNRDILWRLLQGKHGLTPVSQVAIDQTWSAMRFKPSPD